MSTIYRPHSNSNSSLSMALEQPTVTPRSNNTHSNPTPLTLSGSAKQTSAFRAPAHKHAHHLHTIPPREKSTRTLIIDHLLWVHARTRFAQARTELAMTDRTGGPPSPSSTMPNNYIHRQRPENYDEDEEMESDGEDVHMLKAMEHVPDASIPEGGGAEDGHDGKKAKGQDLGLARVLRLRAEGVEKVITSMLNQPPPVIHPIADEDILTPPTSPKLDRNFSASSSSGGGHGNGENHQHKLPNGVRLRLALGTLINDLFARQAHHPHLPATAPISAGEPCLPQALKSLSTVSGASGDSTYRHQYQSQAHTQQGYYGNSPTPIQSSPPQPSPRVRTLYSAGVDFQTANSPPAFRCPRHLHTGCEICVFAVPSSSRGSKSGSGSGTSSAGAGKNGSGYGSGHAGGGGITGYQDETGIGSGLSQPSPKGTVLRRRLSVQSSSFKQRQQVENFDPSCARITDLLPRFLKLSALVAVELGRERKEEWEGSSSWDDGREGNMDVGATEEDPLTRTYAYALQPTREWYHLLAGLLTRAVLEGYLTAGWRGLDAVECLMNVGVRGGAFDFSASNDISEEEDDVGNDEFEDFGPDELLGLRESIRVLFPSLRGGRAQAQGSQWSQGVGEAESEYDAEMEGRLRKCYDIPASTPDLSTHMEDIAWLYPAEPVERAAVRFCEALAKWRGRPELETYKKRFPQNNRTQGYNPTRTEHSQPQMQSPTFTIESLVHSNPPSPTNSRSGFSGAADNFLSGYANDNRKYRAPIDRYFAQSRWGGSSSAAGARGVEKRMRDVDWESARLGMGQGPSKRLQV